jgi:hypothetical protein
MRFNSAFKGLIETNFFFYSYFRHIFESTNVKTECSVPTIYRNFCFLLEETANSISMASFIY